MNRIRLRDPNAKKVLGYYFIFKAVPLIIAAGSIYLGYRLFILGVTGQASLSIDTESVRGQLLNAAPGLFFAMGGVSIVIATVWKGVQIDFAQPNERHFSSAISRQREAEIASPQKAPKKSVKQQEPGTPPADYAG